MSESIINKKTLKYLADLSRIELTEKEGEKLLKDLQKILDYFKELQELDTSKIEPLTGGTSLKNVFREDKRLENKEQISAGEYFPETEDNFLKVPPVFE